MAPTLDVPVLFTSVDVTPGHKCIVTRYHPENPSGQRSLEARVMSAEECAEHEGYENIDDKQICAGQCFEFAIDHSAQTS